MRDPDDNRNWREAIEAAMDTGHVDEAVRLGRQATRRRPDDPDAYALLSDALEASGELPGAAEALGRAAALAPEDACLASDHAWLLMDLGRFEAAAAAGDRALQVDQEQPLAHHVLGWLAERRGDPRAARRHDAEAHALDSEAFPLPIEIPEAVLRQTVRETIDELPPTYRNLLDSVPVVIQPHPEPWMLQNGEVSATVLGFYSGRSLADSSVHAPVESEMPPTIYVFSRCIARSCRSLDEARGELRTTILHELAHHLGFDETDMERLGLA